MDDVTSERLAELLAQLPPAPPAWVRAAQQIGTSHEGGGSMSDEDKTQGEDRLTAFEVEGHKKARNEEPGGDEGEDRFRAARSGDDEDGPDVEGHMRPRT